MSLGRQMALQVVHTLRFDVNYNDAGIAAGVGKQWLPKGAIVIGTDIMCSTAFNAGITNVLTVGTNTPTDDNLIAAADFNEAAGLTQNIKPTGAALGKLAADAQVFAKYTQTGGAATAGAATVIVKYVVNNDL